MRRPFEETHPTWYSVSESVVQRAERKAQKQLEKSRLFQMKRDAEADEEQVTLGLRGGSLPEPPNETTGQQAMQTEVPMTLQAAQATAGYSEVAVEHGVAESPESPPGPPPPTGSVAQHAGHPESSSFHHTQPDVTAASTPTTITPGARNYTPEMLALPRQASLVPTPSLEGQGESERKHPDALPATLPPPPAQLPPPAQPPPAAKLPPSPPSTASVRAGKAVYGSSKAGPSTSQSPASRATSSNPLMPLNPYSRPTPPGLVRSPNGTLMPAGPELAALPAPNQWADVRDMPGVKYGNASLMWKAPVPRAPAPAAAAPPVDVARLEAAADADAMDAPTPRRLAREWDAQLPADAPPANANSPPADVPVLNVHGNASPSASPANAPPANAPPANAPPANPPPANVPPAGANNPDPEQSLWRKIFVSSFRAFGRFMKGIFKNTPRN